MGVRNSVYQNSMEEGDNTDISLSDKEESDNCWNWINLHNINFAFVFFELILLV
jgi:hypothetical protein